MTKHVVVLVVTVVTISVQTAAQNQGSPSDDQASKSLSKPIDLLLNYLNMAGTTKASEFRALTQGERTDLFLKTMVNPLGYVKGGFSAGFDQWNDKPQEWEQGASGYGKRVANILGQYSIQRTVTFALSSALHEDNRYFNSDKKGLWPRTQYAVASGLLARHDDGHRHVSISQLGRRSRWCLSLPLLATSQPTLCRRWSRQLRHYHGEQYGIRRIERISS
jgi:hypothetical protein